MPSERGMSNTYTNAESEREFQEHSTLRVNWEAIHSSPGLARNENSSDGCESSSPVAVGFRSGSWTNSNSCPVSLTLPKWTKNGYGTGGQVSGVPLMHNWAPVVSGEQRPPGMEVMAANNTVYDPENFHSAEHWVFCNEGM